MIFTHIIEQVKVCIPFNYLISIAHIFTYSIMWVRIIYWLHILIMTSMKQSRGLVIVPGYAQVLSSQNIFIKSYDIYETDDIYQARWHFFKDSRYVRCLYLQKVDNIYQVTSLNEFINELVYTTIFYLTCDPLSYHL